MDAKQIYLSKVSEAIARIGASAEFLDTYKTTNSVPILEAAVLQARKALESVAYAAIAPNKASYEKFRAQAEKPADYRKDFNARAILQHLAKINPDFYPSPLMPATQTAPGHWHYERRADGYLTKGNFEAFYDRLGKYLHADNPWGSDKGVANLVRDLPLIFTQLKALLSLHRTIVRTPQFVGVWVVEVPENGTPPHIIEGHASGEFVARVGG